MCKHFPLPKQVQKTWLTKASPHWEFSSASPLSVDCSCPWDVPNIFYVKTPFSAHISTYIICIAYRRKLKWIWSTSNKPHYSRLPSVFQDQKLSPSSRASSDLQKAHPPRTRPRPRGQCTKCSCAFSLSNTAPVMEFHKGDPRNGQKYVVFTTQILVGSTCWQLLGQFLIFAGLKPLTSKKTILCRFQMQIQCQASRIN